jgi:hypothetical protein
VQAILSVLQFHRTLSALCHVLTEFLSVCLFVNSGTEKRERQQDKEQEQIVSSVDMGVSRMHTVIKGSELHVLTQYGWSARLG